MRTYDGWDFALEGIRTVQDSDVVFEKRIDGIIGYAVCDATEGDNIRIGIDLARNNPNIMRWWIGQELKQLIKRQLEGQPNE